MGWSSALSGYLNPTPVCLWFQGSAIDVTLESRNNQCYEYRLVDYYVTSYREQFYILYLFGHSKSKRIGFVLVMIFEFIEVDLWLTLDKHHLWSSWARKLLLLLRCGKSISQRKVLWIALEFENNGSERQSRLQEYAENGLESCLDNIAGSNLSKGMTKASLTWLVTCKNLSAARLCHLGLLQMRCLEDDTLTTSLASL